MNNEIKCFICQDFKVNVGHETKWCPKNICQKCGQNGHTKMECMTNFEDFPLPNEILFKIFTYLNKENQKRCSKVSKRFLDVRKQQESRMTPMELAERESKLAFLKQLCPRLFPQG